MKRIVSFFVALLVFVFNCVPVFALDSYLDSNFQDLPLYENYLNTINTNLTNYKYIYYAKCSIYWGQPGTFVYSNTPLEILVSDSDSHTIIIKNNSSDISNIYLFSHYGDQYHNIESTGSVSFAFPNGGNFTDVQLLIYNKDCVSQTYCSADIYIEYKEDTGDYEEDGVIIKGLTGFFNKITSSIDNMVDNLITELKELIGLPPDGYFNTKFEEIKTSFDNKYNFSDVYEIFDSLKSVQAQKPTFDKTFNLSVGKLNIPFHFKIDFDFIDGIREYLFVLMRAFGYFYLIIYNMNQYYLLFRGQRFFYDMRESYSYKDSSGKEHNHTKGEKKWY